MALPTKITTEQLEGALAVAKLGVRVFPVWGVYPIVNACRCGDRSCTSPGKHPMFRHWQEQTSRQAGVIEHWWNKYKPCNFGILGDDLIVVDVDTYHGGRLRDLPEGLPKTNWVTKTGGGGWHLCYVPGESERVNNARVQKGVDLKAAGGFVVAPGGHHVTGGRYRAVAMPRDVSVAVPWPREHPWPTATYPGGPLGAGRTDGNGRSKLAQLLQYPAEPGGRNNYMTQVAGHLAKHVPHQDAFFELLNLANRSLPYPLELLELDKIAGSVWSRERMKPVESVTADWEEHEMVLLTEGDGPLVPSPDLFTRSDGVSLLYAGKVHGFHGEPEAGKGWAALVACAERMKVGERTLYIDFEDSPGTAVERLLALGVEKAAINNLFGYVRPSSPMSEAAWTVLQRALDKKPSLCIIDGVTEAMVMSGWDPLSTKDAAKFMAFLRKIADYGPAVILIDHVVKNPEGPSRYAFGAQHKLAQVDVQIELKVVQPITRSSHGHVHLRLSKDRLGGLREHAAGSMKRVLAELHLDASDHGHKVVAELRGPEAEKEEDFTPTNLMAKHLEVVEVQPGLNSRELRDAVPGKSNKWKDQARDQLIREGRLVRRDEGKNKFTYWLPGQEQTGQGEIV